MPGSTRAENPVVRRPSARGFCRMPTLMRGSRKKIRSVNANVETAMAFVNQKNLPVIRRDAAGAAAGPLAERGAPAAVLPVRWYSSKLQTAVTTYSTKTDTYHKSVVKAAEASTAMREIA